MTALIAAGVLPLEDGVRFAARRAELTQAAADAHPGKMAALLGATLEQAEDACAAAPDGCWVANDNAPGQVVIAGTPDGLEAGSGPRQGDRRQAGHRRSTSAARSTPRSCSTRRPGSTRRSPALTLASPTAPVVSNDDAVAYSDADGWRARLPRHVSVPVRWRSTMDTLVGLGATTFLEVGHGSMLAALAKRGAPSVTVRNVATPEDIPHFLEVG